MITLADFLGFIFIAMFMASLIGFIINGIFSIFKYIR